MGEPRPGSILQLADETLLLAELEEFKASGGTCLVDQTPRGCGRDPAGVKRLAEKSGLFIVMGCGWYTEPFYPSADDLARRSVDSLADQLLAEIQEGPGRHRRQARPDRRDRGRPRAGYSPLEERVHRAAARAQVRTACRSRRTRSLAKWAGANWTFSPKKGVDLSRVCIGHCDSRPYLDYCLAIVERGAYVAFDNLGAADGRLEERIVGLIMELADRGYRLRSCYPTSRSNSELSYFGGRGFTYLTEVFVPRLRAAGASEDSSGPSRSPIPEHSCRSRSLRDKNPEESCRNTTFWNDWSR